MASCFSLMPGWVLAAHLPLKPGFHRKAALAQICTHFLSGAASYGMPEQMGVSGASRGGQVLLEGLCDPE